MEPEEALRSILDLLKPVDYEIVQYNYALGRVLLEEVVAKIDSPPYNNAAMDGFAFSYDDLHSKRVLKVAGTIKAGDIVKDLYLKDGECIRIMTGAAMPCNADTVIEFEKTKILDNTIEIVGDIEKGKNVRIKGEDVCKGESLKDLTFQRLTPAMISRLVSTGNFVLKVNRKIRVAIISTGNELKYPCETIDENTIIESNGEYIKSVLSKMGVESTYKGICPDNFESLKNTLESSEYCDAIVTIGGVSKGDFDVLKVYGEKIGIKWVFNKVNQKPGKPFSFGIFNDKPVFSFPGNPLSSAFCLFYYLLPAIRKMMGLKDPYNKSIKASLAEKYFKKNNRNLFLTAQIFSENTKIAARPIKNQHSNIISALMCSNGYVKLPAEMNGEIKEDTIVDAYIAGLEYF